MTPEPHRMPPAVFTAVAAGGGGSPAVRHLGIAQRSKNLLLVRSLVEAAAAAGHRRTGEHDQTTGQDQVAWHDRAAATRSGWQRLAELEKQAPEAVSAVLSYPAVSAWALRTVQLLRQHRLDHACPERLAAVAAAAAVRARAAGCAIVVPRTGSTVSLPSLGVAQLPGDAPWATVRVHGDGARVVAGRHEVPIPADPHADAPGWQGIRRFTTESGGLRVAFLLDDLDPYRFPGSIADRRRLAECAVHTWSDRLAAGWRLLVRHHRPVAAEVQAGITMLTPLVSQPGVHLSATSRQAFGGTAMSLPTSGRWAALTLAHEVQHAKLAALMDMFELTRADPRERYYAPWRSDPRPFTGLLHGTYAHLGVARFWYHQRDHETGTVAALNANTEFALWREAALEAARFMAGSGLLTEIGARFVGGILTALLELNGAAVPEDARTRARRRLEQHRTQYGQPAQPAR